MRQLLVSLNLLFATLLLAGCGQMMDGKAKGEDAVKAFHANYNANDMKAIVALAGPEIIDNTKPGEFEGILAGVRKELGPVQTSKQTSFNVNVNNGVSQIELLYDTQYKNGTGKEEFVWRMTDSKTELAGWHIYEPKLNEAEAVAEQQPAE